MIRVSMLVLISGLLVSCSRETEIHQLAIDTGAEVTQAAERGIPHFTMEYFVIANPPKQPDSLLALVDSFNYATLDFADTAARFEHYRLFYKETRFTPRDFTELEKNPGHFEGDDYIERHGTDILKNW